MRWESLFADLEGELEAAELAELGAEVADRTRRERAAITLLARLQAHAGRPVVITLLGGSRVAGELAASGPGWMLLDDDAGAQWVIATAAVGAISGLGQHAADIGSAVLGRLDLGYALRALARQRATGRLLLRDGSELSGTLDRVGRDALDLAVHPFDQPRRAGAVQAVATVPFSAFLALRSV